jgi:hypothetical protein
MHDDKSRVDPIPMNVVLVGTKYDKFEKFDTESRKWIARTVRYMGHMAGASVIFSS